MWIKLHSRVLGAVSAAPSSPWFMNTVAGRWGALRSLLTSSTVNGRLATVSILLRCSSEVRVGGRAFFSEFLDQELLQMLKMMGRWGVVANVQRILSLFGRKMIPPGIIRNPLCLSLLRHYILDTSPRVGEARLNSSHHLIFTISSLLVSIVTSPLLVYWKVLPTLEQ